MSALLCLDRGSSSLKFAAYRLSESGDDIECIAASQLAAGPDADVALEAVLAALPSGAADGLAATGHRFVFGGSRYVAPAIADDAVLNGLEALVEVEPLHLRGELDLVYAARRRFPNAQQVLCFDTAFHRRSPAIARRLPLPRGLDPLIERYGFHGLSYEYVASQLPPKCGRTIIAHLGSGASLCALEDGSPIDTTMGFSALGGLMMSTRPGDLDPGIILRLLANGYDRSTLSELLYCRSGLAGVSGSLAGMKELLERSGSDSAARDAVELFTYQLIKHLGAMIAVLGGLETLVFTAGIGENAPTIRARACAPFEFLGLRLDEHANRRTERVVSAPDSRVAVIIVRTDENSIIARHATSLLRTSIEKGKAHV